jgi:two-component system response regulator
MSMLRENRPEDLDMNNMEKMILLVEDNPDHEALTLRALRKAGLANPVVVARDGAEAIDFLFGTGTYAGRNISEMPQTVLLDLKLPKIDGLEVLQRMRSDERTRLIPVVVLTSSDEEKDLVASYKYGANSYIRKPVDFVEFVEATRQLGLYWLVLNEPPRSGK